MPLDKNLDLGALKHNSPEWQETYNKIGERADNAQAVRNLSKETQETLLKSASSAVERGGDRTMKTLEEQLLELDWVVLEAQKAFVRTMHSGQEVREVEEHQKANRSDKTTTAQKSRQAKQ
ncbi:hypothetical protein ISF_05740 [Cordyceps fumosorosea ARSEF 2679]|uniref:Uncharacterized protein n=1 Tax=Cordyceps fumosorosea (strain ARSEF 2679) TaxID=1081104 RepID=A0A167TKQ6_CORFA|nr:hypothetical protein ISF_05740 [Cordyceps fumosorosea ARSEF 2679]OAA60701.1 hypothetical protein ISF_05740 [Cordyceps fumosorosea ARSEF 2679]